MPVYTITFELNSEGGTREYKQLVEELQKQKCVPVLRNHWLGSFNNNAVQVQNHFKNLIGKADRIMVAELFRHYAFSNCQPHSSKWLELNPASDPGAARGKTTPVAKPEAKAKPAQKAVAKPQPAAKPAAKVKPSPKAKTAAPAKPAASKTTPAKKAPVAKAAKSAAGTAKKAKA